MKNNEMTWQDFSGTRRRLIVAAALLAGGCAHGKNDNPYSGWVSVRSEHFVINTDTSAGTYKEVIQDLEAMHTALRAAFFPNTNLAGIEVLLFSTPESARKEAARATAPFVGPDIKAMVLTSRSSRARGERQVSVYSTLYEQQAANELLVRMLRVNMRRAPLWFRIGLESYAETVEIQGNQARFGHRLPKETHELAAGRVVPLGQLISAPASEFRKGDWNRSHRASAWAFIHYLFGAEKGALRSRFDVMARALVESDDEGPAGSRAAIEKAFPDVDFATLEGRVRDYAVTELGQKIYFHPLLIQFPSPPSRSYVITPADPDHVRGLLTEMKSVR